MTFVIDASVAAEVLLRTELGERARAFLGKHVLVAPELVDAEVLSVIRRHAISGAISRRRARDAIGLLKDWPIVRLQHRPLLNAAFDLMDNLTAYDALYVAAAAAVACPLVTADGPLARAPLRLKVHNIGA